MRINEAVIIPEINSLQQLYTKLVKVRTIEEATRVAAEYDVEIVDYDTFYNELSDVNKKTAPPKHERNAPIFGLLNMTTKKPRIVINTPTIIPQVFGFMMEIIAHERVHVGQDSKFNRYILPDPSNRKDYFSNKDEIMAFSYNIAKEVSQALKNDYSLKQALNRSMLYKDIKSYVDFNILKRYHKYIMEYLEKMHNFVPNADKEFKGIFKDVEPVVKKDKYMYIKPEANDERPMIHKNIEMELFGDKRSVKNRKIEIFDQDKIHAICKEYGIRNYTIENGMVNVEGDVNLSNSNISNLPLNFGRVTGFFDCGYCKLTTLDGSPHYVGGSFSCRYNNLKSLYNGPRDVMGSYLAYGNNFKSLNGLPDHIGGKNGLFIDFGDDYKPTNDELEKLEKYELALNENKKHVFNFSDFIKRL